MPGARAAWVQVLLKWTQPGLTRDSSPSRRREREMRRRPTGSPGGCTASSTVSAACELYAMEGRSHMRARVDWHAQGQPCRATVLAVDHVSDLWCKCLLGRGKQVSRQAEPACLVDRKIRLSKAVAQGITVKS